MRALPRRFRRLAAAVLVLVGVGACDDTDGSGTDTEQTDVAASTIDASVQPELEPNDALGAARMLPGSSGHVRGSLFGIDDVDLYAFDGTAGDRVYATTMTSASAGGADTRLAILDPSGATLEMDEDDGNYSQGASAIGGATLLVSGTHYIAVSRPLRATEVRPYDLFYILASDPPVAEIEPNNTPAQAHVVLPGQEVLGVHYFSSDTEDYFGVDLQEGDTLFVGLDERTALTEVGMTIYDPAGVHVGGVLNVDGTDPQASGAATIARQTGRYVVRLGTVPVNPYRLAVAVIPPQRGPCHVYTSPQNGQVIGAATAISTIPVTDDFEVGSIRVRYNLSHPRMNQVDVVLTTWPAALSPSFTEGVRLQHSQFYIDTNIDLLLDPSAPYSVEDLAGLNTHTKSAVLRPPPVGRLEWFEGVPAHVNWSLVAYDTTPATDNGTINNWSLTLCEPLPDPPCPAGTVEEQVFFSDFGASSPPFTTQGSPSWINPPAYGCADQGNRCYGTRPAPNSNEDLYSPSIDLTRYAGPVTVSWRQSYQLDDAAYDHAWVDAIGGPSGHVRLWENVDGAMITTVASPTVVLNQPAHWGRKRVRADELAGSPIRLQFHVDTDDNLESVGWSVDDVSVRACRIVGCGNGALDPGEQCDDGNAANGDGCDANCTPTSCGNGVATGAEPCDDGNFDDEDGCTASCVSERCGDGAVSGSEACDDGNLTDADGCDSNCAPTGCGNGVRTGSEQCDDGNAVNGDGCTSGCSVELRVREVEPNDDVASAMQLQLDDPVLIDGDIYADEGPDFFAVPMTQGDRLYLSQARGMGFATVDVLDPSGAFVETVLNSIGSAGVLAATTGTYHVRVTTTPSVGGIYQLALHRHNTPVTDEIEPNDTDDDEMLLTSGMEVRGHLHASNDQVDRYAIDVKEGERISIVVDPTPPENATPSFTCSFNSPEGIARSCKRVVGLAVPTTGRYHIRFPTASSTGYYRFSIAVDPPVMTPGPCQVFESTAPMLLPDGQTKTSTIVVPASADAEIGDVDVTMRIAHNKPTEIPSATLVSPGGNEVELFSAVTASETTAPREPNMVDLHLDDGASASLTDWRVFDPFQRYAVRTTGAELAWFNGGRAAGTWTLRMRDGTCGLPCTKGEGAVLGWSLRICSRPPTPPLSCPAGSVPEVILNATFEQDANGFVVSGTGTQWARGTPTFAPITSCGGGTRCFKTNRTGAFATTNATHDLTSPLLGVSGFVAPIRVQWKQKYDFNSRDYHHAWVEATGVNGTVRLWEYRGHGMPTGNSAGWHPMVASIAEAGIGPTIKFHLDGTGNATHAGYAVDDVVVEGCRRITGCGNGALDAGELCDDGNLTNGDGCDSNCTPTACGNGIVTAAETCDDGNAINGDGCDSNCRPTGCGNGIITPPETCDDGNAINGDGCDSTCTPSGCGNGVVGGAEECDDGDLVDGDGCDSNCTFTGCPNGVATAGEECDDGDDIDGDGCDSNCTVTSCQNGIVTAGEDCDDGDDIDGDGCDSNCTATACGNGILTSAEECDDANLTAGDGCDAQCNSESTSTSTGTGGAGSTSTGVGGSMTNGGGGAGASEMGGGGNGGAPGTGGAGGGAGVGGDAGAGGAAGGGGVANGGAAGTGGTAGSGGAAETGGAGVGGAGANASESGGAGGGPTGSGEGGEASPGPGSEPSDGCGCMVGEDPRQSAKLMSLGLLGLLAARRRRAANRRARATLSCGREIIVE